MSTRNLRHSFFVLVILLVVDIASCKPGRSLRIKLIHRNSVKSPYYNPNASPWDLAEEAINSSIVRAHYFNQKFAAATKRKSNNDSKGYDVDQLSGGVSLIPNYKANSFLANVSLGTPEVPQLLTVDTGSSLLWVHCAPCWTCPRQATPMYDSRSSSTYKALSCPSSTCTQAHGRCVHNNECVFANTYMDGTYAYGNLGSEWLSFGSEDEGIISVNTNVFGCVHQKKGHSDGQTSGIFGLGYGAESLVYQLGGKFSICTGDIRKPDYEFNTLIFNDGANLEGTPTPIVSLLYGHYHVVLEGISIEKERLDIDPNVFSFNPSPGGEGGTFLDSGTTLMLLTRLAYNVLHDNIAARLDKYLTRVTTRHGFKETDIMLCYKGLIDEVLKSFQFIALHFRGGAEMILGVESTFVQIESSVFCLASWPTEGYTVIGNYAQQFHNIGYDVAVRKAYIEQVACKYLDS